VAKRFDNADNKWLPRLPYMLERTDSFVVFLQR
jgi:hypothetical protein